MARRSIGPRGVRLVACMMMALAALFATAACPARAATPEEVDTSIKKGIDWLYSQLDTDGNWDFILKPNAEGKWSGGVKQTGGPTSLAVYALLSAGETSKDPRLAKAVNYLKTVNPTGTYAVGFHASAFAMLPESSETKQALYKDETWIRAGLRSSKNVRERGFYGYGAGAKSGLDRSTSQVAVLGAWACAQANQNPGSEYWKTIEEAWRRVQGDDGHWNYTDAREPSIAMTAAGVATLFVTQEYLHAAEFSDCNGSINDPYIEKGLKWVSDNFSSVFGYPFRYYALYSIERCGSASGYKFFGTHNWYAEGSEQIVKAQSKEGSWGSIPDTSFALLFLSRGRSPVAVNKLQYTVDNVTLGDAKTANWNQRPRDVANVCRWAGRQQERTLNWQIVNLTQPADDMEDAPVLYIAGNQPLKFSDEEAAKLRQFVEEGGLILANADCGNARFIDSYKKLGQKLFPAYEFRTLPADHVIYTGEQFPAKSWKKQPNIVGMSNGSRELMLAFVSDDAARFWQMHTHAVGHEELHQVMSDIFAYAVEQSMLTKGAIKLVRADPAIQTDRAIKIARLQYPGNWDPEPAGWRRLSALLRNEHKIDATVETIPLGEGKLDNTYAVAHLTGTAKYAMTAPMKAELKKYVEGGGTLVVDACGGSSAYAVPALEEITSIFAPGQPMLPVLPPTHAVYSSDFPGAPKIAEIEFRAFARATLGQAMKTGRLRGIDVKGRPAVYFSAEDLSTALMGHPVDGVTGYTPQSAMQILKHIVLLSLPKPAP